MKPLICKQCGGSIDPTTMRCPYCGTRYEQTGEVIRIDYAHPHAEVLRARIEASSEYLSCLQQDELGKLIRNTMTRKLAESLEPFVEYTVQYDPAHMMQIVRGRVRVLPPGYRF